MSHTSCQASGLDEPRAVSVLVPAPSTEKLVMSDSDHKCCQRTCNNFKAHLKGVGSLTHATEEHVFILTSDDSACMVEMATNTARGRGAHQS
jgi:hypothetical protein